MFARGPQPINAATERAATERDALPLGYSSLLGTVLTPEGPYALVHLSGGRIDRVTKGDMIDGATITAIERGTLTLQRGSDIRRMSLPTLS